MSCKDCKDALILMKVAFFLCVTVFAGWLYATWRFLT